MGGGERATRSWRRRRRSTRPSGLPRAPREPRSASAPAAPAASLLGGALVAKRGATCRPCVLLWHLARRPAPQCGQPPPSSARHSASLRGAARRPWSRRRGCRRGPRDPSCDHRPWGALAPTPSSPPEPARGAPRAAEPAPARRHRRGDGGATRRSAAGRPSPPRRDRLRAWRRERARSTPRRRGRRPPGPGRSSGSGSQPLPVVDTTDCQ